MSVHTKITFSELENFLSDYTLGALAHFEGIYPGVTNTIYTFTTNQGKYILTLFEELKNSELEFYIELINYLADQAMPTPRVILNQAKSFVGTLKDKPTVVMQFLPGDMIEISNKIQCFEIGKALGKLHQATQSYSEKPITTKGTEWRQQSAERLYPLLSKDDVLLLKNEIMFHQGNPLHSLPQGIIHADLFRENVLFTENQLTGLLDFYYACYDYYLYDLAVTINDWCVNTDFSLNQEKYQEFIRGYETHRRLTLEEKNHFNDALRLAALRFWLSRLLDLHFTPKNPHIKSKDPNEFKNILLKYTG